MDGLVDFFMDNIMFLFIVIGGILSLLGRKNQENEDTKGNNQQPNRPRQQTAPRPTATPSGGMEQRSRRPVRTSTPTPQTISIEEQQQQQLEKLAGRMNTKMDQALDNISSNASSIGESLTNSKKNITSQKEINYRKQIKGNLSRKGLVNSVIMAEVLGPPRARKPYQSVVVERNK